MLIPMVLLLAYTPMLVLTVEVPVMLLPMVLVLASAPMLVPTVAVARSIITMTTMICCPLWRCDVASGDVSPSRQSRPLKLRRSEVTRPSACGTGPIDTIKEKAKHNQHHARYFDCIFNKANIGSTRRATARSGSGSRVPGSEIATSLFRSFCSGSIAARSSLGSEIILLGLRSRPSCRLDRFCWRIESTMARPSGMCERMFIWTWRAWS